MEAARVGMQSLTMRIGNFNSGVHQPQLTGKNKNKVLFNVNKIIHVSVQDSQLDMMSLCEVGGHMQGFASAGISAKTLPVLNPKYGAKVSIIQHYMTCWNFQADASQPSFQKLRDLGVFVLTAATEPQLVVEVFSFNDQVKLVKGNLHIRIPTNTTVTQTQRKRLVTQALAQLEAIAKKEQQRYNDAPQPIVCVLLGDTNLEAAGGNEAVQPLQPTRDRTWEHA